MSTPTGSHNTYGLYVDDGNGKTLLDEDSLPLQIVQRYRFLLLLHIMYQLFIGKREDN